MLKVLILPFRGKFMLFCANAEIVINRCLFERTSQRESFKKVDFISNMGEEKIQNDIKYSWERKFIAILVKFLEKKLAMFQ